MPWAARKGRFCFGFTQLLFCLQSLVAQPGGALPQTRPLEWAEADLSARLMDGAHQFVERKIAESERCIADYVKRTRRPLGTDLQSLSNGSWSHWDAYTNQQQRKAGSRSPGRG